MAEGHSGGHFKLVLALVLIAGIMGLIAYANTGERFLQEFKLGRFANVDTTVTSEPFGISMSTGLTVLYGKSFALSSSPFSFSGICSLVQVGGLAIESEETRCSVSSEGFTGTFQYTPFGSMIIAGSGSNVKVGPNKYSAAAPISFEFEVIPTEFFVSGINENKVSLVAPSGKIERYGKDGSLNGIESLSQSTLDLNSLVANVQLENGELKITGTATSVKSEEFSW